MKQFLLTLVVLLGFGFTSLCQDIHWSQPYAAPIYTNPAHTGFHNGLYRFGGNMRMQWNSVTVPYKTISAWSDFNTFMFDRESNDKKSVLFKNDYFGYGVLGFADMAGDGNLSMKKGYGLLSYHIMLSKEPIIMISLGSAFGYVQKSIEWDKLYFDDQWNGKTFTNDIQTAQRQPVSSIGYFDFSTGLMVSMRTKKGDYLAAGWARHHVNTAAESFVESMNELGVREIYHFNFKKNLSPIWLLEGEAFFQTQKLARELITSILVGYKSDPNSKVTYFQGVSYRYSGDIVPVVGAKIGEWRVHYSYDINISKLRPASQLRGGSEISFVKIGNIPEDKKRSLVCPHF